MGAFSIADKNALQNNTLAIKMLRVDLAIVALAVRALCRQADITDPKLIEALDKLASPKK